MINQETKQLIAEQFKRLPAVVQDIVLTSGWEEKIRRIVQNNKLHIDQGAAIENLVFLTMLGIEGAELFAKNAEEYARVSPTQAEAIALEVEREIFHEIRQKLMEITETHDTIEEVERVTNELTKVDDDIEQRARVLDTKTSNPVATTLEDITLPSKATKITPTPTTPSTSSVANAPATITTTTSTTPVTAPVVEAPLPTFRKTIPLTQPAEVITPEKEKPRVIITLKKPLTELEQTEQSHIPVPSTITTPLNVTASLTETEVTTKPASTAITEPSKKDIAPKAPVSVFTPIPKSLDSIIAARLGKPTTSARERLVLEVSDSVVTSNLTQPQLQKEYGHTDPYREPIK